MSAFFDRLNIVKRRREAKARAQEKEAQALADFRNELRTRIEAVQATEDPVARYIALAELPAAFDARRSEIQEQKFRERVQKNDDMTTLVMKGGGVAGVGLAIGLGVVFGPVAGFFGAFTGLLIAAVPGFAMTEDTYLGQRDYARHETKPFSDCVENYKTAIRDICARLEDAHLEKFAASPEWNKLTAINPGLHTKLSDAFRATVAKRADSPPSVPPITPPQKGFSL